MKLRKSIALFAVCLGSSLFGTGSWAACSQLDGSGSWNVYITIANTNTWAYCAFKVAANGAISTGTRCTYANATFRTVLAGSSLKVNSTCVANATVNLSGGVTTTFNHMTFSRDKLQFSGVGSDNFGVKFTYNGIKL